MFGHPNRGPAGYVQITTPDGARVEYQTLRCVHCGCHWIYQPGSGRKRGWCMRCDGTTCGARKCLACVPYEAQIEILEGASERTARRYLGEYRSVVEPPGGSGV